ncbi:hypothetical protein INT43_002407 [Umbelopsis isabellina]|uniref:F-box domain-containing protein n=1 Tax=Mortierella isabellina TaxID=91625 RepID=A0A8H7Q3T4_MORIS|nr:hypothetical protein INT43_002407 [Umbelopsis isabellina]
MQDKKQKRLTRLIHPLKRLSLLSPSQRSLVPETTLQQVPEHIANDLISCLPHETAVAIFALLCFKDLIRTQLVCKSWRRIASDAALWRQLYVELSWKHPTLGLHRVIQDGQSWHQRYSRATALANWSTGEVQNVQTIHGHIGRVLSVKIKERYLITLGEDDVVNLYEFNYDKNQFQFKRGWEFGQSTQNATNVKCIDILPEINVMVVAQRGSKCLFYDISKGANDPIQAFDNQAHRVFLSEQHVITSSVDGSLHTFHIPSHTMRAITTDLPACCLPCLAYDGSLSLVAAPYAARRLHHFEWKQLLVGKKQSVVQPQPSKSTPTQNNPEHRKTSSSMSLSASMSSFFGHFKSKDPITTTRPKSAESQPLKSHQLQKSKMRRQRRHSSYNDFGWECNARTTQYIKNMDTKASTVPVPDFSKKISLVKSISTSQLGFTTSNVVGVAVAGNRAVMVNRAGDMAIVMLDSGLVNKICPATHDGLEWIEDWLMDVRDNDEDQDGYNFSTTRLSIDSNMGIVYGGRNGAVWFLSFNCTAE